MRYACSQRVVAVPTNKVNARRWGARQLPAMHHLCDARRVNSESPRGEACAAHSNPQQLPRQVCSPPTLPARPAPRRHARAAQRGAHAAGMCACCATPSPRCSPAACRTSTALPTATSTPWAPRSWAGPLLSCTSASQARKLDGGGLAGLLWSVAAWPGSAGAAERCWFLLGGGGRSGGCCCTSSTTSSGSRPWI